MNRQNTYKTYGKVTRIYFDRRDGSAPYFLIDTIDLIKVLHIGKWRLAGGKKDNPYVMTRTGILLHRFLMKPKRNQFIDHRNGIRTDCRRKNLRLATKSENAQNQPIENPLNKSSGYKNVVWNKTLGLWMIRFKKKGHKPICKWSNNLVAAKKIADGIRKDFHPFHHRKSF